MNEISPSVFNGMPENQPALAEAIAVQRRAASVGFDWQHATQVLEKIIEEVAEVRHELATGAPMERLLDEVGDVLFACTNLARLLNLDPEQALRSTNAKFARRFREIERRLVAQGCSAAQACLEAMEVLWAAIKKEEREHAKISPLTPAA